MGFRPSWFNTDFAPLAVTAYVEDFPDESALERRPLERRVEQGRRFCLKGQGC
jgi:hypothetical protein